jgi:cytochrome c oxidase cbb3-type subunit 3
MTDEPEAELSGTAFWAADQQRLEIGQAQLKSSGVSVQAESPTFIIAMTGVVLTKGLGAQAPQGPPQAPAPAAGRGADPAQGGGAGGRQGAGGGGRRGGFTQFTRELAPQDVLVRGKGLYEANCASCHAVDLRGTADGKNPNLLRSGIALTDQHGELVGATVAKHTPALTLVQADTVAIAEYIHSVHATMGGQGSPPGRNPTNVTLNVLVGDAKAGEGEFSARCAGCHTGTRSLNGIATKYPDPRTLQNTWFVGSGGLAAGARGGGGGAGQQATVTMADGTKLQGTLVRKDDFLVVLTLADGTRRSIARHDGVPKVDVVDPREGHKGMAMKLIFEDPENKKMHDITAFLATLK